MSGGKQVFFPPFTLDTSNHSLQRGTVKISLRPKTLSVLAHLIEHPHRLVSKGELMLAAWPNAKVVDAALRVSIQEIRKALGDGSVEPKFIETVGKKGYRFVAPVSLRLPEPGRESFVPFVGRTAELDRLKHHLEIANSGKRQVVFVTGEPGIGKTTLVEAFVGSVSKNDGIITPHGQCIEQYGAGESYMPILDALERMCNGPNAELALKLLRQYAPSWLLNLPRVIDPTEHDVLSQQAIGITPERKLREIAGFLESLSKDRTLLLILEDLQWLDPSSLALISFLARRREAARLMLIGTYRAGEVESQNHPLKHVKEELELHQYCSHLPLKLLSRHAVGEYLAGRFETLRISNKVLSTVYRRSDGNPLFMVNVTDYLVAREVVTQQHGSVELGQPNEKETTPTTLRQLVERHFERLSREDQELLEVASVRGVSFSAAILAAVLGRPIEEIEKQCSRLVKREHFLQSSGSGKWPNGTISSWFSFIHALYQNVIYDRIGDSRKTRLHQTIGERLEAGYKGATEEIAAELATHFERGGDQDRAVSYLCQATQKAVRQCGYQEAINYANTGLKLLKSLAPTRQRKEWELSLQFLKGISLASARGYASTESRPPFSRARSLAHTVGNDALAFQTLAGMWSLNLVRGDLRSALELGQQMGSIARRTRDPNLLLVAHATRGVVLFYFGDFIAACDHLNMSAQYYNPKHYSLETSGYGWDPAAISSCYKAKTVWLLGYPQKAHLEAKLTVSLTRKLSNPFHAAFSDALLAVYYGYCGYENEALQSAETAIKVSNQNGFDHPLALGMTLKGWALERSDEGSVDASTLQNGIRRWKTMGAELGMTVFCALQAEGNLRRGEVTKGLAAVEEGLTISKKNTDCHYDAELYRLKGELLLKSRNHGSKNDRLQRAEESLRRAVQIARRQKAKSLELKATVSLARLWQKTGKEKATKQTLAKIYRWFTEGFDTPDLKAAKELLAELS